MRVMHLLSDSRWTGPAEPVLNLVAALGEMGLETIFACARPTSECGSVLVEKAAERGIYPQLDFYLDRHWHPVQVAYDLFRLSRYFDRANIDIVHTHLSHDHILAGIAARRAGRRVVVVRTNHKGIPFGRSIIRTQIFRRYTDAYLGFSWRAAEEDRKMLLLPKEKVCVVNPAVDLERFDPSRRYNDVRQILSVGPKDVLGGIVARVQRHRRFHVLLRAVQLATAEVPDLRFLIIGRGTHIRSVAKDPVRELGLEKIVKFSGYRSEDYVDYVQALDFKVFLVPGSDGTCRAVREAMALGKPVIAARRGMLEELVLDGKTGLLVDDEPADLAKAIVRLARDGDLRERLGRSAREHALRHFRIQDQAESVATFYSALLASR